MKIVGVDFDANKALFVVIDGEPDGPVEIVEFKKLQLDETREAQSLKRFRDEVRTFLVKHDAFALSVRSKPENGQMRAGAAALKMEALVLAESGDAEVSFVSSVKAGKIADAPGLFAYLQTAYKAAVARVQEKPKKKR
jgi:hypothetical protein